MPTKFLSEPELVIIKQGRRYFELTDKPKFDSGDVVRLRSSRRDPGFEITISRVFERKGLWRVMFVAGDTTEHHRFLTWSGSAASVESARGYTDVWEVSMRHEPEAVDDSYLKRFAEDAQAKRMLRVVA